MSSFTVKTNNFLRNLYKDNRTYATKSNRTDIEASKLQSADEKALGMALPVFLISTMRTQTRTTSTARRRNITTSSKRSLIHTIILLSQEKRIQMILQ